MKRHHKIGIMTLVAGLLTGGAIIRQIEAADEKPGPIKEVMQTYHKAPKGTDTVAKKAQDGKATPEELKKLVAGYKSLVNVKPPKGDEAGWQEKAAKLLAATQALEKGEPDGLAKFKEAVNCKACHSVHRPDSK